MLDHQPAALLVHVPAMLDRVDACEDDVLDRFGAHRVGCRLPAEATRLAEARLGLLPCRLHGPPLAERLGAVGAHDLDHVDLVPHELPHPLDHLPRRIRRLFLLEERAVAAGHVDARPRRQHPRTVDLALPLRVAEEDVEVLACGDLAHCGVPRMQCGPCRLDTVQERLRNRLVHAERRRFVAEADRLVAADEMDVDVDQPGKQRLAGQVDRVVGSDRAAVGLDLDDPVALDLDRRVVEVAAVAGDQMRAPDSCRHVSPPRRGSVDSESSDSDAQAPRRRRVQSGRRARRRVRRSPTSP